MAYRSIDPMTGIRPSRAFAFLAVAIAVVLMGCSSGPDDTPAAGGEGPVSVVATTTIWGDVVRQVTGADADVEVLIPVGADIHAFQLSSQQVASIENADLVVANGLELEEGMRDALEAAEADGANILWVAEQLDPLPFGQHESEHQSDAESDSLDPHVWLDPRRVADAAFVIADRLAEVKPGIDWAAGANAYATVLSDTDAEVVGILEAVAPLARKLVTNHDAFGYFADRYGFEIIGVVIPGGSTLGNPSSAELASLVGVMRAQGVTALFTETTTSPALADAVAAELGQEVAVVDLFSGSLGPVGSGAESLTDMLVENAERIASALVG